MHLRIRHEIRCSFDAPARNRVVLLRLWPRSHDGQYVTDWRIDADLDCSLKAGQDGFGNITHSFSAAGRAAGFVVTALGDVETVDMAGIVQGWNETLPVELFLRDTALTVADEALRAFARDATAGEPTALGKLHALREAINDAVSHAADADERTGAQAFAAGTANARDHAHIFVSCARHLGLPSRFVSGYRHVEGKGADAAVHAWAEAFVDGFGWIAFDTVENLCPQDRHVRIAAGLDALGAGALRAVGLGGLRDTLTVTIHP